MKREINFNFLDKYYKGLGNILQEPIKDRGKSKKYPKKGGKRHGEKNEIFH